MRRHPLTCSQGGDVLSEVSVKVTLRFGPLSSILNDATNAEPQVRIRQEYYFSKADGHNCQTSERAASQRGPDALRTSFYLRKRASKEHFPVRLRRESSYCQPTSQVVETLATSAEPVIGRRRVRFVSAVWRIPRAGRLALGPLFPDRRHLSCRKARHLADFTHPAFSPANTGTRSVHAASLHRLRDGPPQRDVTRHARRAACPAALPPRDETRRDCASLWGPVSSLASVVQALRDSIDTRTSVLFPKISTFYELDGCMVDCLLGNATRRDWVGTNHSSVASQFSKTLTLIKAD